MEPEEIYPISITRGSEFLSGTAKLFETSDDQVRLVLITSDHTVETEAPDYFEALQKARRELVRKGMDLYCYGASRDVYPSGMSRSMGGGLQAYRLVMGKQATGPLLNIFDFGPDIDLASVEDQDRFFEAWIESLGRR